MRMNKILMATAVLVAPAAAMAHGGHGGLAAGLTHPLTGWDHLLAMVAVGMLAAQVKGRAQWALPAAFVAALAAGGMLGVSGLAFGPVEGVIAASLVVLGGLVAVRHAPSLRVGLLLSAGFGLFHGFAHGLEAGATPALFLMGMVLMSALLHGLGLVLTRLGQQVWAHRALQAAGLGMAAAGAGLMLS